uniref:NAC domain-containing protein 37-like n=1 Tax=Nicotiana tabacum TaxID=4097 RepID=A0A1S4A9J3_TOBAC|nr:PREDICTED: NAC domain-containing protein 37-like [Nicotiana tabacum]
MSTVPAARRRIMGKRFHPTEGEMINFLKRFLKGETLPSEYRFQHADIYGDRPPWEIFGVDSNSEEKVGYFFTQLKKQKSEHTRVHRTCANGTWKAQTGIVPIKNGKGIAVGFRRNFKFQCSSKEREHNKIWLMKEYYVGDDFFGENNIPKEDIVVCRIKKNIREKKVKDDAVSMDEQELAQIIEAMLHGPDEYNCILQPAAVCQGNETHNEFIENTMLHAEYAPNHYLSGPNYQNSQLLINSDEGNQVTILGNQNNMMAMLTEDATTNLTTLEQEAYDQLLTAEIEQGHGADHHTNNDSEFWEAMKGILEDVNFFVPEDWQNDP